MATGRIFNIQKFSLHDGPGIRTVVFLKGCPMSCSWCANPESQKLQVLRTRDVDDPNKFADDSRDYTIQQVLEICEQDRPFYDESGGGVTLSGGEPLVQHRFATSLLHELRQSGIHTAIETTGCVSEQVFAAALEELDLVIMDVKHWDSNQHRQWTGQPNTLPLRSLDQAVAWGGPLLVRIPVIPGVNDSIEDAKALSSLLAEHGVRKVELLPFHQFGERKYELLGWDYLFKGVPGLHAEDLAEYQAAFDGVEAVVG
ncbi:MAG: glycyl-radical enzyme activating protein [Propionibacteriaceae bacterium]|nr:glycyl-radical enzyme activating protein [Propionibacteriaceae bacterium]